jgi:hypothetical protein
MTAASPLLRNVLTRSLNKENERPSFASPKAMRSPEPPCARCSITGKPLEGCGLCGELICLKCARYSDRGGFYCEKCIVQESLYDHEEHEFNEVVIVV